MAHAHFMHHQIMNECADARSTSMAISVIDGIKLFTSFFQVYTAVQTNPIRLWALLYMVEPRTKTASVVVTSKTVMEKRCVDTVVISPDRCSTYEEK
jgi:hypothetical protein